MQWKMDYFGALHEAINTEEKEQLKTFAMDSPQSLKELKRNGLALSPLKVNQKYYGYADYPELKMHCPYPFESKEFRDGATVELICAGEEGIKATLLQISGRNLILRLYAPDFPDWIEDSGVGIKIAPDVRTLDIMRKALDLVPKWISDFEKYQLPETVMHASLHWRNEYLNDSQKAAIANCLKGQEKVQVVHGPPGTGKTTTLVELIFHAVENRLKVAVCAPSNAAVDHIARQVIPFSKALRLGNNTKVDDAVMAITLEGKMQNSGQPQQLKKMRQRADELRKMAHQYKRNFGRDERMQRGLLLKEVSAIRKDIKEIRKAMEEKWFEEANVVLGTPVGFFDQTIDYGHFDILIIDEAGQCLEPLAWGVFPLAKKWILAGDPFQLPPTVLSREAAKMGLNFSILERALEQSPVLCFLDTQYRMPPELIAFSNAYFYQNQLKSINPSIEDAIFFYDTVGTGADETFEEGSSSITNPMEADYLLKAIEHHQLKPENSVVISPYSGQVHLLKSLLDKAWKISTIDSFQGQEAPNILLSLVRSNSDQTIGFLQDYRRMNVALTRAKKKMIVIGDSSTLSTDKFYGSFLDAVEKVNGYKSCWELV